MGYISVSLMSEVSASGGMPMSTARQQGSALPKAWITPIRLAIYSMLAACSAYIYFTRGELEFTHILVIISIVAVSAMALLDCRLSEDYWRRRKAQETRDESR
jgi:hypothetical protein